MNTTEQPTRLCEYILFYFILSDVAKFIHEIELILLFYIDSLQIIIIQVLDSDWNGRYNWPQ